MSSCSRRSFLAAAVGFAAAGCTLEPALKRGRPVARLPGQFKVSVPGGRTAFQMEERLSALLGSSGSANPQYLLMVDLSMDESLAAAAGAGGVDRKALSGNAAFSVSRHPGGMVLTEGSVRGQATFSASSEVVATDAAREDAEQRLVAQLAERLVARLMLTSDSWHAGGLSPVN